MRVAFIYRSMAGLASIFTFDDIAFSQKCTNRFAMYYGCSYSACDSLAYDINAADQKLFYSLDEEWNHSFSLFNGAIKTHNLRLNHGITIRFPLTQD